MSKTGNILKLTNNLVFTRISEVICGTGIPLIGFVSAAKNPNQLLQLIYYYPLLLIVGWHIVKINDLSFEKPISILSKLKKIPTFISVIGPLLIVVIFSLFNPVAGIILLIIIINWNIYSLYSKNFWLAGLSHNFLGGGLHFLAGVAGTGNFESHFLTTAIFFSLAMTSGAIHHDSIDTREDHQQGYQTGATRFGATRWWRLGPIPLVLAQPLLLFSSKELGICFATASAGYFLAYLIIFRKSKPESIPWFRLYCRLVFAMAALGFIVLTLLNIST